MRRFAPIGLAVFLLLLAGWGSGIGFGDTPRVVCTVGCVLDVYPCIDPVTNRPASEGGSHCPSPGSGPGSTPEADSFSHGLATSVLRLVLGALALLICLWWWLNRDRVKVRPDAHDGRSEDRGELAVEGPAASVPDRDRPPNSDDGSSAKLKELSPVGPAGSTTPRSRLHRVAPIGVVLVVVVASALAGWPFMSSRSAEPSVSWGAPGFRGATAETTTVVTVTVGRPDCIYWDRTVPRSDTSWLAPPVVSYTPTAVTITLQPSDAFEHADRCWSTVNGRRVLGYILDVYDSVRVQLSEPLRGRALFDGSTSPPAARPYPTAAEVLAAKAEASAAAETARAEASAAARPPRLKRQRPRRPHRAPAASSAATRW